MSNLGKETSRQTFRDKLLDNNKLLVGSVAVLFITSFTFGATFIGLSHGNSEERSQPKTVNNNTVQETVHKTTPSNDNSEVQSVSMNNKEQKIFDTPCSDIESMKAPDRVGFLKEAYDSGFRRTQEGENLGDDYSNMTNAVRKGCANDITAKVGDFVSIQTSEYKGEYR